MNVHLLAHVSHVTITWLCVEITCFLIWQTSWSSTTRTAGLVQRRYSTPWNYWHQAWSHTPKYAHFLCYTLMLSLMNRKRRSHWSGCLAPPTPAVRMSSLTVFMSKRWPEKLTYGCVKIQFHWISKRPLLNQDVFGKKPFLPCLIFTKLSQPIFSVLSAVVLKIMVHVTSYQTSQQLSVDLRLSRSLPAHQYRHKCDTITSDWFCMCVFIWHHLPLMCPNRLTWPHPVSVHAEPNPLLFNDSFEYTWWTTMMDHHMHGATKYLVLDL